MKRTEFVRRKIDAWMYETIRSKRYKTFDDLHIDEVDSGFREPGTWLDGSVRCLELALVTRNSQRLPFSVALGMSLLAHSEPIGVNFADLVELPGEFDHSPPSLYLFERGSEPWLTDRDFQQLGAQYRPRSNVPILSLFRQWYDENDTEYRRSFWFAG